MANTTENFNDYINEQLEALGLEGSFNDKLYKFLEGYLYARTDRYQLNDLIKKGFMADNVTEAWNLLSTVGLPTLLEQWTVNYDQSALVEFPEVVLEGDFDISVKIRPDSTPKSMMSLSASRFGGNDWGFYAYATPNTWLVKLSDIYITSSTTVQWGELTDLRLVRTGSTVTFYVNGEVAGTQSNSTPVYLDQIGTRGNREIAFRWIGEIYNLNIKDLTNPANSRYYESVIVDENQPTTLTLVDKTFNKNKAPFYSPEYSSVQDRFVTIPPWQHTGSGGVVTFKARFDSEAGEDSGIISSDSSGANAPRIYYNVPGNNIIYTSGFDNLTVDGIPYAPGGFFPQIGEEYEFSVDVLSTAEDITHIQTLGYATSLTRGGRIWDIRFIDNVDSTNNRIYPGIYYSADGSISGTVFESTESSATLSTTFATGWVASGGAVISGNNISGTTSISSGFLGRLDTRTLDNTIPITLEFDVDNISVDNGVRLIVYREGSGDSTAYELKASDIGSRISVTVNGPSNFGTDNTIAVFSSQSGVDFSLSNITVKQEVDGTLVGFPVGNEWVLSTVAGGFTDGEILGASPGVAWTTLENPYG